MTVGVRIGELSPTEVQRVGVLLDAALDLAPAQREAWQSALRHDEPVLAGAVEQLLAAMSPGPTDAPNDAHTDAPTDAPARMETADLMARHVARATRVQPELAGRRFGPYRVLRLLGQGGMGSVWLAERADGLFERQVALKIVHASLLTGHVLDERFARERSILGALDHPHIARLLDAGQADDGQPYLALDYVEGETLTTYCDSRRLTLAQRLGLMLQVLSAVHYAHQNLVIHRDLKPANILVTGQGQVRLLDFGIAKLLTEAGQPALETELTQMSGRALTPEYASPEQIAGRAVSTASDVYALGVLLYNLLCGRRPYALPRDTRAALEEAILHAPALRPSQQPLGDDLAQARGTTPRKLAQALAGDLDTIVLKALKKDPAERYATADALAQDLQRYLSGQPVQARPDSAAYRLRKFAARHKLQVVLGSAVLTLVLVASGVSLWQAQVAREQAVVAQRESQRAQAVQAFLLDIFKANSVQQPDPLRARQTTARELLDVGAKQALESLKDAPLARVEVLQTLADMYFQLELGDDAARMRLHAVEALKQAHGPQHVRVAAALIEYANDISMTAGRERSAAALEEAGRVLDAIGDHSSDTRGRYHVESVRYQQYSALRQMRDNADAAVRHYRAHPDSTRWEGLVQALQFAGRARYLLGDLDTAEAPHFEALAVIEQHHPGGAPVAWHITPLVWLAELETQMLKLGEAERHLRRALAISLALNGELSGATLQTQAKLGGFLHATGRRAEGHRLMEQTLQALRRPEATATPDAVGTLDRFLGAALVDEGALAAGERHLAKEIADLRATYAGTLPLAKMLLLHGQALVAMGRHDAAQAELEESARIRQRVGEGAWSPGMGNAHLIANARLWLARGDAASALEQLARIEAPPAVGQPLALEDTQARILKAQAHLMRGDAVQARAQAEQALSQVQASALRDRFPVLEAEAELRLGQALMAQGERKPARRHLAQALALRQAHDAPESPWLAEAQVALAGYLADLGELQAARSLARQAQAIHARQIELGAHLRAPLRLLLVRLA